MKHPTGRKICVNFQQLEDTPGQEEVALTRKFGDESSVPPNLSTHTRGL